MDSEELFQLAAGLVQGSATLARAKRQLARLWGLPEQLRAAIEFGRRPQQNLRG